MDFEKVLVTGAGGLLGRYVVNELKSHASITGLDIQDGEAVQHRGTIEDYELVARACNGQDAVVHVAARPNIWSGSGSEIVQTNVTGTWNILEAAERAGVRRVIITSSDSVVGYTVLEGAMIPPDYLPVDDAHPLRPTDPYALSKLLGERMAQSYVMRGRLEVLVIRPVYVLYPEFEVEVRARAADPEGYVGPAAGGRQPAGGGRLWHYVDPRDLARAYRLALESRDLPFGAYFISGPNTLSPEPTVTRLERLLGRPVSVRDTALYQERPFAPAYDLSRAREQLGYEPVHDFRETLVIETE
ncbi:MAG: NAD(P)-dependent oxidoreductase [Pseudomonadota bacterium]